MPDVLIYADTVRSPELRREVPLVVPDPFLYAEVGGVRHVAASSMELPRIAEVGDFELHPREEFGSDELVASGLTRAEIDRTCVARAVAAFGVRRAVVPETFPLWLADRLRADGVEIAVDHEHFVALRRAKTPVELAGMRRAQRAAEAGLDAARDLLRRAAAAANGGLRVDGRPLTVELVKAAMSSAFVAHDTTADEFIVAPGPQGALGHDLGSGPISAGVPIVIDVWPRDNRTAIYADMTRTFVVGDVPDDVRAWHTLCREALERSLEMIGPGVEGRAVFDAVCDIFEAAGEPTARTKEPGSTLGDGFFHGLGHGVGLAVHEAPALGHAASPPLEPGDVVTVEPGLYRRGYGGVRLEDLVRVTEEGCENLTAYPYDLEP